MPVPTADEKLAMLRVEPPTDEELAALETLKPGDYEVGFQRTNDLLDEALEVFERSCRSSMGIAGDVMVALFTAQGDLVNGVAGTYLHAIIQPIVIKYILQNYSENPGIADGDIWFANDALYGGIHNPDMIVVMPIYADGELIGWCGAANHTTETGAVEPGGMPVSAISRFMEGLNLPPVKIGENFELRHDWLEVFNAFGIRAPQMMTTDLNARCTAADRARRRVLELVDREGKQFVVGLFRKMLIVAEEGARKRIASWPDGTFRAVAFCDAVGNDIGLVRNANLTMTKLDDTIILDFAGTSPETPTSYNAHVQAALGHLANYIYSYIFYDLPISSATFAPLECRFPEGTLLNPDQRAATSCSVMICSGVMSVAPNAFAKMIFSTEDWTRVSASAANAGPGSVIAGLSQWGLPFADLLAYSLNTDGQGGRPWGPGMNAAHFAWCPFGRAPNVEMIENEFPLLVPVSQHWTDSGGHGMHRGGCGTVQTWMAHNSSPVFFMCVADNSKIQTAQPLFGGYGPLTMPGISVRRSTLIERLRDDSGGVELDLEALLSGEAGGEMEVEFMGRSVRPYDDGDIVSFVFSGGGAGYGDPLDADPDEVLGGVIERSVSDWAARELYRVSYDIESGKVDESETDALRAAEREARLERGKPWDEFIAEWSELKPPEEILQWFGSWPDGEPLHPIMRF
jgi:N-methylhydantoinase B/oxoprolinase/acetone carboxylase alpha subunit